MILLTLVNLLGVKKAGVLNLGIVFLTLLALGCFVLGGIPSVDAANFQPFPRPWIARLLAVGAATATLGVLLSQILGISRMMLAMSRRGDLPAWLAKVHKSRKVPACGILATGAIALTLALTGTLESDIAAAAFTILIYYAVTHLAALRLPRERRLYPSWIAATGLLTCIAMAAALDPRTILHGLALLAASFGFRFVLHRISPPAASGKISG